MIDALKKTGVLAWIFCVVSSVSAVTIRSKSDMRLWETATDFSAPLSWPWAEGARSATIALSNRLTRAVSTVSVRRGDGETRGIYDRPAPQSGETLLDVTLVQMSNDGIAVQRDRATIAYVNGSCGRTITVRSKASREWETVREASIVAFDPAWRGEEGPSGYDVVFPQKTGFRIYMR